MGLFISLGFGVWLDQLVQGDGVWAAWNYFRTNLIEGKASEFSKDPLWFYLTKSLARGVPPLSIVLFLATLFFWWRKPKSAWTWATLSFFVVHTLISHKEVRFLNFIFILSPFFLCYFLAEFKNQAFFSRYTWFAKLIVAINIILLLVVSFRSPRKPVNFYQFFYKSNISEVALVESNTPFLQAGLVPRFYLPKIPTIRVADRREDLNGFYFVEKRVHWREFAGRSGCELWYSSQPRWLLEKAPEFLTRKTRTWGLFKCSS